MKSKIILSNPGFTLSIFFLTELNPLDFMLLDRFPISCHIGDKSNCHTDTNRSG